MQFHHFYVQMSQCLAIIGAILSFAVGCDNSQPLPPPAHLGDPGSIYPVAVDPAVFHDSVSSNRQDDDSIGQLQFVDPDGRPVRISDYAGKKNVVLVFTRGFSGQLCPYCTTQTSRLISNYPEFVKRDAEILLVYPGSKEHLPQFKQASTELSGKNDFPFPVLLDEDLRAVKQLGIEAQLAHPSTFIIDREGHVRLSYVGTNMADRPSVKALLEQLDAIAD